MRFWLSDWVYRLFYLVVFTVLEPKIERFRVSGCPAKSEKTSSGAPVSARTPSWSTRLVTTTVKRTRDGTACGRLSLCPLGRGRLGRGRPRPSLSQDPTEPHRKAHCKPLPSSLLLQEHSLSQTTPVGRPSSHRRLRRKPIANCCFDHCIRHCKGTQPQPHHAPPSAKLPRASQESPY